VLKPAIDAGRIRNVGEAYTDGWLPANAQRNMEQFLTRNNNRIDAVIAANDGTAGGAIAALAAQGLAGSVPVSGQDADRAALNRIAQGTQTLTIWKDARELGRTAAEIAVRLAGGTRLSEIPNATQWNEGPQRARMTARFLTPVPVNRDNLGTVIEAGWAPARRGLPGRRRRTRSGLRMSVAQPKASRGFGDASGAALRTLEVDPRLIGMLAALAAIWVGFDVLSGGAFLTPRNLWNLSVQTASIAVMACGMVLVIVTRNIDLSVGAILGVTGMVIGVLQARMLPEVLGLEHPATWLVAVAAAVAVGGAIGAFHGALIAYLAIPSFIVTLGGLLVWRGAAWWVTQGQTVAPMDGRFRMLGGGIEGAIGASASWIIGGLATAAILAALVLARRRRLRFGFPVRPAWAEAVVAVLAVGAVLGAVMVANSYPLPAGIARRMTEAAGGTWVPGTVIPHGLAVPVLLAIFVGIAITVLATRTRFGRAVFAIGGNPEAAELSGINTRRTIMMVFALMGALCGLAACISTARLNAATNAAGSLDELYVIAAAVIGGTSLAGGAGTIAGAMLGALVMQSLQSGMVLLGVDAPMQNIVVGLVLVTAVWLDTVYRRRIR
jgi:D-xylose transport system permease protein